MSQYRTVQWSLRLHSLIICAALVLLTAFLGWKVYSLVREQASQMQALVQGDFRAHKLLQRIEGVEESLKSANRKYWITRDESYAGLITEQTDELAQLRRELLEAITIAHPEFTESAIEDTAGTRAKLESLLTRGMGERERAASGILKAVHFAIGLSVLISLWVTDLFFRRLGIPLRRLKEANRQIGQGNLAYRIEDVGGAVAELEKLAGSFNQMAARLQELDRTKYEFFSEVSHQIKNPLAALKEGLDLLANGGQELALRSREKALAACTIATRRLESMIENLMQHARIERGFHDLQTQTVDLTDLVRSAMAQVQPLADKSGMQLSFSSQPGLQARMSAEGMTHVVENLLMNAIRYGEERSPVVIEARLESDGASLSLRVTNQARFLPTCAPERLFERFFRGNAVDQPRGFGLGLYIVKSIVEAHRGNVRALVDPAKKQFSIHLQFPISEAVA